MVAAARRGARKPRSVAVHLARVKLKLMPQRLEQWPHDGPMLVREGAGERVQYHVVDGWQHLATFEGDDLDEQQLNRNWRAVRARADFSIDSYRILTRMLREPRYRPRPLPRS